MISIIYRFAGLVVGVRVRGSNILCIHIFFDVSVFDCCFLRTVAHLKLKYLKRNRKIVFRTIKEFTIKKL